jgi:hypothetical protein
MTPVDRLPIKLIAGIAHPALPGEQKVLLATAEGG